MIKRLTLPLVLMAARLPTGIRVITGDFEDLMICNILEPLSDIILERFTYRSHDSRTHDYRLNILSLVVRELALFS